ncbi:MAG: alcohol dehydrogenase [Phycisphaerales bacterium]|nr:alcohol dehydrogenase [Phycisphaerales bacterium]
MFLLLAKSQAGDWPQFLGPARNGVAANEGLAAQWPAGGPTVLWSREVGQGFAGPVAAGGKVVLFHRAGEVERVECMEAKAGKVVWSAEYPTAYQDDFNFDPGPRAMPTIAGERVYTFGAEGALHCWEFATGKPVWAVDTKKQFAAGKGFFGMVCSPLVEGNAVILNIGGADGAGIVAFDKDNGKLLWKATDDEASYSSPVAATFHGKRYVLVFSRAGLVAIDPPTGKVEFRFPWRSRMNASVNAATPLVIDDLVFISASYNTGAALLRIGEKGPEKVWSGDDAMSNHYATCVYADGFLYGFDGRQESGPNLRCVELKTGKVRWSEDHFGAGNLLLAGGRLLVLTEKGELIGAPASPDGFKPTGRAQILGFGTRAYPALADGLLFARDKGKLVCIDLRAGAGKAK